MTVTTKKTDFQLQTTTDGTNNNRLEYNFQQKEKTPHNYKKTMTIVNKP